MGEISVVGCGYVGLTVAVCMAHLGHNVVAADVDRERVEMLNRGQVPMFEARLDELLDEGLRSGRLRFVDDPQLAVTSARFHFMCVPTPQDVDGSADLSRLEAAIDDLADLFPLRSVVITKSTVPVGTADQLRSRLSRTDIAVVSCPEFLREGTAIHDFLGPDRIVIGALDDPTAQSVAELFAELDCPILTMTNRSAEAVKYGANAFLATKLSFINSMARICESVGADIQDVARGMAGDERIGGKFLAPGPGWGGSCFPKDVSALSHLAQAAGSPAPLLNAVLDANHSQLDHIASKALQAVGPTALDAHGQRDVVVGVWGLTFKAGTSDRRDSPAIAVIHRLLRAGVTVQAFDPTVSCGMDEAPEVRVTSDPYEAAAGADVLVVLTEWDDFTEIDLDKTAEVMNQPRMIDARNLFARDDAETAGFSYAGVGR